MRATVSMPGHRVLLVPEISRMSILIDKAAEIILGLIGSGAVVKWVAAWLRGRRERREQGLSLEVRVFDEAAELRKEAYAREKAAFDELAREREARHAAEMRAAVAEHFVQVAQRDATIEVLRRRLARMSAVLDHHSISYVDSPEGAGQEVLLP